MNDFLTLNFRNEIKKVESNKHDKAKVGNTVSVLVERVDIGGSLSVGCDVQLGSGLLSHLVQVSRSES